MMLVIGGVLVVWASGIIGMVLHFGFGVCDPPLYWTLGAVGGVLGTSMIYVGLG